MVVLVVQYVRIAISEFEGQPPISADLNRPAVPGPPFERMQPVTRHVHIIDHPRSIQGRQLQTKSSGMFGLDAGLTACLVVALQTFVLERLDHRQSIARCASRYNFNICVFCTEMSGSVVVQ